MSAYSNIQALFKRRYGPWIKPLPSEGSLAKFCEFVPRNVRPGENYNFPVEMGLEHGVTHNTDGTAFALSSVQDSIVKNAQLDGSTIMVAGNIPYDVMAKSMNGEGSYEREIDRKVNVLMRSGELYREIALAYGPGSASAATANLGAVNASVSGANLAAPQVVNITRATWSSGLWNMFAGGNALVDIVQSDATTSRETDVTVQAMDTSQCRLTLFKSGSSNTVAAGDLILPRGSRTKSATGIEAILGNTGSLFGISAATYPQWKAYPFAAGAAALTLVKVQQLMSHLADNGLDYGGKLFVNSHTFDGFVDELDDRDRYNDANASGAKKTGTDKISVKSPAGMVDIQVYKIQKQGQAFFLPNGKVKRVGASDLTFGLPGTNKWFYVELPSNAGSQIRVYGHMAPVIECPYHAALITGIVNASDVTPS